MDSYYAFYASPSSLNYPSSPPEPDSGGQVVPSTPVLRSSTRSRGYNGMASSRASSNGVPSGFNTPASSVGGGGGHFTVPASRSGSATPASIVGGGGSKQFFQNCSCYFFKASRVGFL